MALSAYLLVRNVITWILGWQDKLAKAGKVA